MTEVPVLVLRLHVFSRTDAKRPNPAAEDALELGCGKARVLELFEAPPGTWVTDLSLAERHLSEVVAALRAATEVHLHGVNPRAFVDQVPFIPPGALEQTQLVVHQPWPKLLRTEGRSSARLGDWPGPVSRDQGAPAIEGMPSTLGGLPQPMFDLGDARFLPRACGAAPVPLDGGQVLARVGLDAGISEASREVLIAGAEKLSSAKVIVSPIDEREVEPILRTEVRRAYQGFIAPELEHGIWPRATLEALAQGLPVIVIGDPIPDAPPATSFVPNAGRALDLLTKWSSAWLRAESAPIDQSDRRVWLETLIAPPKTVATFPR